MVKKQASLDPIILWLAAGTCAGLAAWAVTYFRGHPERSPLNVYRQSALDRLLAKARLEGAFELRQPYRYVLFSDHHMGLRECADNFRQCEPTYLAALDTYYRENFTLVEMGDVEELLENGVAPVMQKNARIFESTARFHPGRYLRVAGNHDGAWKDPPIIKRHLERYFPGIRVWPQLLFHFEDTQGKGGEIICIHGHQGTLDSDLLDFLPPLVLPVYRIIQNLTGIGLTSPARDIRRRGLQDNQMYTWADRQRRLVLVAGHTHRPIWSSLTHQERLVMELHALQSVQPLPPSLAAETGRLQTEIERRALKDPMDQDELIKSNPCYFNTGCCSFKDGDITGIEIADGEMRLVKWGMLDGKIQRTLLEGSSLGKVFAGLKT